MEIRSLEIDFDKNILKINGEPVVDKAVIAALPGPEGWLIRKVFNVEKAKMISREECDRLEVTYTEVINSKL